MIPPPWAAPLAWDAPPPARPVFRLAARIIDLVVLIVLVDYGTLPVDTSARVSGGLADLLDSAWVLTCLVGLLVVPQARWGVTLGKRIVGLRLVRVDGTRAGVARIIARELIALPGCLPSMVALNYWIAGRDELFGRALHDKACGTYVAYIR